MIARHEVLRWRERLDGELWEARAERGFKYRITRCRPWTTTNVGEHGPPYYDVRHVANRGGDYSPIGQADNLKDAEALAEADFARRRP